MNLLRPSLLAQILCLKLWLKLWLHLRLLWLELRQQDLGAAHQQTRRHLHTLSQTLHAQQHRLKQLHQQQYRLHQRLHQLHLHPKRQGQSWRNTKQQHHR